MNLYNPLHRSALLLSSVVALLGPAQAQDAGTSYAFGQFGDEYRLTLEGKVGHFDLQGGASPLDPVGNGVSAEPALDPQFPEPLECAHQGLQKGHGPASFDRVRRHDGRTEHEAK